jgi:CHAD domain-containing protein
MKNTKCCIMSETCADEGIHRHLQEMHSQLEPLRREEIDAVHDMRVASRRLRAVLAEHRKMFNKKRMANARDNVRRVTQALGRARELDVAILIMETMRGGEESPVRPAASHALAFLKQQRAAASTDIAAAVELIASPAFAQGLEQITGKGAQRRRCYFRHASRSTFRLFSRLSETYWDWTQAKTDAQLHQVRIAFKKFRYACEIYSELYGPKMKKLINELKDAQEALGNWHDYSVLNDYVNKSTEAAPTPIDIEPLRKEIQAKIDEHLALFTRAAKSFFGAKRQEKTLAFLVGDSDVKMKRKR